MDEFVTRDDAREHMRIDSGSDDRWLAIWIPAVSASVAAWLKQEWRLYVLQRDSDGELADRCRPRTATVSRSCILR